MASKAERLSEIISVFGKYGFGEFYHRSFKNQPVEKSAENLRLAFEELGPSFIKIGQTLSTRNDLLSDPYIKELEKLQNSSASFPFSEADQLFQEEIGKSLHETFPKIQEEALATGSIAQVHLAELEEGSQVIVKIQRPNIQEKLITDINLFIRVINMIPSVFTNIIVDPVVILEDIRDQSIIELNFYNEAQSSLKFMNYQSDRSLLKVPKPYLPYVTEKVMVQEYIPGIDLTDQELLMKEGYDLAEIAEKIVISFLHQVFEDGYYHADPHPGNILIHEGKLVFIDFGIMGEVPPMYQKFLIDLLQALVLKDMNALTHLILTITKIHGDIDESAVYRDVSQLYNRYMTKGFKGMDFNSMFQDILRTALKHGLTFPTELVQLSKTVMVIQGIAQNLDSDMDFMGIFSSYVLSSKSFRGQLLSNKDQLLRQSYRTITATAGLPAKLDKALDAINNDRLSVNLNFREADKRFREINQMLNRLVIGILLAAIIVSSGLIVSADTSGQYTNVAFFFFIVAIIMAVYLLYSFIRSRHK